MTISTRKGTIAEEACDLLVIGAVMDAKKAPQLSTRINDAVDAHLAHVLKEDRFKAKEGATMLIRLDGRIPAKRVLVVGLGTTDELTVAMVRRASAQAYHALSSLRLKRVLVVPFGWSQAKLDPIESVQAMVEGFRLAEYTYGRYKKKQKQSPIDALDLILDDGRFLRKAQAALELAQLCAAGTIVARDLVNTPALHMAPKDLVASAKELVQGHVGVRVKVFNKEQLKKMGAGGILAVNQGSDHDPFMVHLTYKPKKKAKKVVAFVGKAVTFDSGGLSLKPADGMMTMKIDMSGAAAVIGLFSVLSELQPNVEVHGIFGAVENMPSGKAIRPGDVVTAMNGKTIEILNTDAEGRVTLADTLTYAGKLKPDMIIDLATLTGACMVALGEEITGLMSNNPELAQRMLIASTQAGEQMWELPLYKPYQPLIVSDVADVKNIGGGRYGGALTAGLFLQEFVDKAMPWIHLDIAGPAFAERPFSPYEQKGATGHPVRTLIQFLRSF